MKLNKDNPIPLEAAVKYLIRERDGYKQKLDLLVPYTKRLEVRLNDTEKLLDITKTEEVKKMGKTIERLEMENRKLIEEKSAIIKDYHTSEWFKGMQRTHQKLRERIFRLRESLDIAYKKLSEYEGK